VRQHRLADDVADRKDVRDIGAHLAVDRDVARSLTTTPARSAPIFLPLGFADRLQDQVIPLRLGRRRLASK